MGPILFLNIANSFRYTFYFSIKVNLKKTIILLFLLGSNHYAQEVAPLQLGNIWVYDEINYRTRHSIIDTSYVIDSIKYFTQQNGSGSALYLEYLRLNREGYYAKYEDTTYPAQNHEKLYYKKNSVVGDMWINPTSDFPLVYTLVDTFRQNLFGQMVTIKHLEIDGSIVFFDEYWTEEFGVLSRSSVISTIYFLRGCVIDGVVYGDTSIPVNIRNEIEVINDFALEQNYPNPFNPTTTINISIPTAGKVQIIVYNSLGEVVSELINKWYSAGEYSIDFTAQNLPSGVYFYRALYDNKSIVKKMLFIK